MTHPQIKRLIELNRKYTTIGLDKAEMEQRTRLMAVQSDELLAQQNQLMAWANRNRTVDETAKQIARMIR